MILNKDKIENFAFNIDRPFCAEEAADFCGVSLNRTKGHLKDLRSEGKITIQRKVINKYFYVWNGKPKQIRDNSGFSKLNKEIKDAKLHAEEKEMIEWLHENRELYYARMG